MSRRTPDQENRDPIRIGVVTSLTGPMAGYGTQSLRGFQLGLEYATDGTGAVRGQRLEVLVRDDGTDPAQGAAVARTLLDQEDCAILQGCASSSVTLLVARVAEEYRVPFLVAPAAADSITTRRNRYVFRTASNVTQDALAGARYAVDHLGKTFAFLAPRTAWGKQTMNAWGQIIESRGGTVLAEIYGPLDTTDFEGLLCSAMASGAEVLLQGWAGASTIPLFAQMKDLNVYDRMRVTGGLPDRACMEAWGDASVGFVGMVKYFYTLPRNRVNDWLVRRHQEEHGEPPDLFTACSFAAAQVIVQGLRRMHTARHANLIQVLEGMRVDSPKGPLTIRKQDHQALQSIYIVEMVPDPGSVSPMPKLIQEIKPEDCAPPITDT